MPRPARLPDGVAAHRQPQHHERVRLVLAEQVTAERAIDHMGTGHYVPLTHHKSHAYRPCSPG